MWAHFAVQHGQKEADLKSYTEAAENFIRTGTWAEGEQE